MTVSIFVHELWSMRSDAFSALSQFITLYAWVD